jgi:tellurite resistance protein TehA-like permease
MATGIVSLGARQEGLSLLSSVLLWLTAVLYTLLFVYHAARFARRPRLVIAELRTSVFDYPTCVAAGCVLASGLLLAGAAPTPAWVLHAQDQHPRLSLLAALFIYLPVSCWSFMVARRIARTRCASTRMPALEIIG